MCYNNKKNYKHISFKLKQFCKSFCLINRITIQAKLLKSETAKYVTTNFISSKSYYYKVQENGMIIQNGPHVEKIFTLISRYIFTGEHH